MLDMNDEDGVCGANYQEWYAEQFYFEPDYNPDEWYDPEQDNEWPIEDGE